MDLKRRIVAVVVVVAMLFVTVHAGKMELSASSAEVETEDEENALAGNADYVTDDNSTNMLPADIVFTDKLKELFRRVVLPYPSSPDT